MAAPTPLRATPIPVHNASSTKPSSAAPARSAFLPAHALRLMVVRRLLNRRPISGSSALTSAAAARRASASVSAHDHVRAQPEPQRPAEAFGARFEVADERVGRRDRFDPHEVAVGDAPRPRVLPLTFRRSTSVAVCGSGSRSWGRSYDHQSPSKRTCSSFQKARSNAIASPVRRERSRPAATRRPARWR